MTAQQPIDMQNPLRSFFDRRKEGRGIWKWEHYFDIYDRHFRRFRGREAHVLEIGVYSGGSLDMWHDYFGPASRIYGVDVEPACRAYESEAVRISIGDQADRAFWARFRQDVPLLDIVIDDGGHLPEQQTVSLEELLPHLRPGGVYLCEDIHGAPNAFASHVHGLAHGLNEFKNIVENPQDDQRRLTCASSRFQSDIASIHLYPFIVVVEKNLQPVGEFVAPKHGTQWQPFLK
jgi:hypothetical protein